MISKSPRKKLDSKLVTVIAVSGAVHIFLGVVLGGITVVEYLLDDKPEFEAPDAIIPEEPPPPVEVKIKLDKQKLETEPLKMKSVAQITVDQIDVNLPEMADSFSVSAGVAGGSGNMLSLGGIGDAMKTRFPDVKGFGTTDKLEYAFEGTVYLFKERGITHLLEDKGRGEKVTGLRAGRRQGKQIYNYSLNLPKQSFTKGFPGVTDQFEWFAIDFQLDIFWPPELAGEYEFQVNSDDGAVLFIDRKIIIRNDGMHGMQSATGTYNLKMGKRKFRLAYFQGPKTEIGLIFEYRKVGDPSWKLFDSKELIKYQL